MPHISLALTISGWAGGRFANVDQVSDRDTRSHNTMNAPMGVASRVVGKIRNGAFFRLVKLTTNVPPARAAIGGTRHGQEYQEVGWST